MLTEAEAFQSMLAHHRELKEEVVARVTGVAEAESHGASHLPAVGELVAYLAEEVLPHARAEEQTIYRVAAARPELASLVRDMLAEHRALVVGTERLARLTDSPAAARQAREIAASFSSHVAKENDALLPPLLEDDEVDLVSMQAELHRLTERGKTNRVL